MPRMILIDEFHLTVRAPQGLPESEYEAMHLTLDDLRFQAELARASRDVLRRHPALRRARVTLSR